MVDWSKIDPIKNTLRIHDELIVEADFSQLESRLTRSSVPTTVETRNLTDKDVEEAIKRLGKSISQSEPQYGGSIGRTPPKNWSQTVFVPSPPVATAQDWLKFGAQLKAQRDEILKNGGYNLPMHLNSGWSQWVPLDQPMIDALFDGDKPEPPAPHITPCPMCQFKEPNLKSVAYLGRRGWSVHRNLMEKSITISHSNGEVCKSYDYDAKLSRPESKYFKDMKAYEMSLRLSNLR